MRKALNAKVSWFSIKLLYDDKKANQGLGIKRLFQISRNNIFTKFQKYNFFTSLAIKVGKFWNTRMLSLKN